MSLNEHPPHSHSHSHSHSHAHSHCWTQRPAHDFYLHHKKACSQQSSSSLAARRRSDRRRCFSSAGTPPPPPPTSSSVAKNNKHTISLETTSRKQVSPAPPSSSAPSSSPARTAHFVKTSALASAVASSAAAAAAKARPRSASSSSSSSSSKLRGTATIAPAAIPAAAAAAAALRAAPAVTAAIASAADADQRAITVAAVSATAVATVALAADAASSTSAASATAVAAVALAADALSSTSAASATAVAAVALAADALSSTSATSATAAVVLPLRYIANPAFPTVETELSSVEHAVDSRTNSRVVLKRLNSPETAAHELCILERITAARLPHALALCDTFLDHTTGERVLVFPELEQLRDGLDLIHVRDLVRQLATGLAAAHAAGIAHLDVTRCNLMLDPQKPHGENLVIIDWGLARVCSKRDPHPVGRGTPGYIAPEMYSEDGATDTQPDVYSAGVILGQWLEPYLPEECSLSYLGSRLVRPSTTTFMVRKIQELLDDDDGTGGWRPILRHAATLLIAMLEPDPAVRITAAQILEHPFVTATDDAFAGTTYADFAQSVRDARCGCAPRRGSSGDKIVVRYR
ncbi:Serine/threonine-protein kinase pim-3 [Geranomyces michiganensis]|nr:Serine/threonine-protein kinase pim-3 [Geranomyces michiganensis]